MRQFKKPRQVWLSRDAYTTHDPGMDYMMWSRKPVWEEAGYYHDDDEMSSLLSQFCTEDFELFTGIQIEPGELVRVRIHFEATTKIVVNKRSETD